MSVNTEAVGGFLAAYQRHDAKGMADCLDPQCEFSDIAFPSLKGGDVRDMWRWFCQGYGNRPAPVEVPGFQIMEATGDRVTAEYWVRYFLEPDRKVNYVIRSEFVLSGGKIVKQTDTPVISKLEVVRMAKGFFGLIRAVLQPGEMDRKLREFQKNGGKP